MDYKEIKVLTNNDKNEDAIEKEIKTVDVDSLIEVEWRKRERLQCLA